MRAKGRRTAAKAAAKPRRTAAELQRRLDTLAAELKTRSAERDEALARQAATAEVLEVINASPGDLGPVFDAILDRAMRLCGAACGTLGLWRGDHFTPLAFRGPEPLAEFYATNQVWFGPREGFARIAASDGYVQFADLPTTKFYRNADPHSRALVDLGGARSTLTVTLAKDGEVLGLLGFYRQEVRPFSGQEIALVKIFAAQAVIAIENARLLNETREALAQQTATAEVLQVINAAPGNLQPVFDAILEKAHDLCGVDDGSLNLLDGETIRAVATHGLSEEFAAVLRRGFRSADSPAIEALLAGAPFFRVRDMAETDNPVGRAAFEKSGIRTALHVPLRKDDRLLGTVVAARKEVREFSEQEIALLQSFAAQAVIAMENARLLNETREALEQQTATAEILQVINASPGNLQPVFDAILEKAHKLCGVDIGSLNLIDGETTRAVAAHGLSEEFAAVMRRGIRRADSLPIQAFDAGAPFFQVRDMAGVANPVSRAAFELSGVRTALFVPLRKDGTLPGYIIAARKEVREFSDQQIALLQSFAAQAVIAIENARLITETREALAHQTATAEVLGIINSSPGELAPVFEAILEKAHSLCGAAMGSLTLYDGEKFRAAAVRGYPEALVEGLRHGFTPHPNSAPAALIAGARLIHRRDIAEDPDPVARELAKQGGVRTNLLLPLRKDGRFLGMITCNRREARLYTDKEIALLENFAAQAVIAMENARLITETREALEQQTATAEVLQVINASPGDLAPVFDAMLGKAIRLCGAAFGAVGTWRGERLVNEAIRGPQALIDYVARNEIWLGSREGFARVAKGDGYVQIADVSTSKRYEKGDPHTRFIVELGARTTLTVPLAEDDEVLGLLAFYRTEVRPFSEREIALVKNFAAQAVVAIVNARLFHELRQRTDDLQEALEQQTATAEVLQVINASPGDLSPVFDAMLDKATRLCKADFGILWRFDGDLMRLGAVHRVPPAFIDFVRARQPYRPEPESGPGRVMRGESVIAVPNLMEWAPYQTGVPTARAIADLAGARSLVIAGLLKKDDTALGAITIYRQEVRPFSDKQITLLQSFAAQAVIAMENARLLGELRQRTDDLQESLTYQTAISDVLKVISRSTFDLQPVLDALIDTAARLCGSGPAALAIRQGDVHRFVATTQVTPEFDAALRARSFVPGRSSLVPRVLLERRVVHIADAEADPDYEFPAVVSIGRLRTLLGVPLFRGDEVVGVIALSRPEANPFTERHIELVRTFADQAVIAMENARLLTELRESLDRQTATAELLGVINSSQGDLQPVFDAMLEKAMHLCDAAIGGLSVYEEGRFRTAAAQGMPEAWVEYRRQNPPDYGPGSGPARLLAGEPVVHILDMKAEEIYARGDPNRRAIVDLGGVRSALTVALRRDDAVLGSIALFRQEVRPFSDKQIALLQSFAVQAVIAMENARLLGELRTSLERQTATADILRVIASTPGDPERALDTIAETAVRMFGARSVDFRRIEGNMLRAIAASGAISAAQRSLARDIPLDSQSYVVRCFNENRQIRVEDLAESDVGADTTSGRVARQTGVRTVAFTPLSREGEAIGVMAVSRNEVRPFLPDELELMKGFADQAVIAIENARLLSELHARTDDLQEALEYQTATSDVLKVISRSAFDLQPVLDTVVETAARLCIADDATLCLRQGDIYRVAAMAAVATEFFDVMRGRAFAPGRDTITGRVALEAKVVHVADIASDPDYDLPEAVTLRKAHTLLGVPMLRDGVLVGIFTLARQRVEPFTERQIELVKTFADQAVIAVENARLITATREARDAAEATLRDLRAAQANLIQAEKMASLGQLTAGIAHEIKNPLNFVNNFAHLSNELLVELKDVAAPAIVTLTEGKRAELDEVIGLLSSNLVKITEHGKRADGIVKSMLAHSRGGSGERQVVDLNALIEESLNLAYHGARAQDKEFNITLDRALDPAMKPIELVPQDITRVFLNLFGNGFYAATKRARGGDGNGAFRPVLTVSTRDGGDAVEIRVRDNGIGIAPEIRDKLFQPFFTTKPTGEGTGLGLSISYDIVTQQHGGTIVVESEEGEFTEFTIRLPRRGPAAPVKAFS